MSVALTPRRVLAARAVAMLTDLAQLVVFPAFSEGLLSPLNDALDILVAITLTLLVGWHWTFLPSFVSELIPFWDLVPTWTAAVLFVTRERPAPPPTTMGPTGPSTPSLRE